VDASIVTAAWSVARNDTAGATRSVAGALASAPAGNAGWILPIEPLLRVHAARDAWAPVIDTLRMRAI
jgi:hypothetical protein